ncbi:hypothetical protein PRRU23_16890 [Segatella bryantii]|uniref:Uncharacterized protein n=1 Tax=Segatella bryantii TaxID=77095 RepID=A0AA37HY06_SEGBR|nr:hypothetical protein PRRU23_16890 [Segatella bryantii]
MAVVEKAAKITDNVAPFITEYAINIRVAVASDKRLIAPDIPHTKANSAMMRPKNNILLVNMVVMRAGLVATPYAVTAVMTRAKVIQIYTLRINAGNAKETFQLLSFIIR